MIVISLWQHGLDTCNQVPLAINASYDVLSVLHLQSGNLSPLPTYRSVCLEARYALKRPLLFSSNDLGCRCLRLQVHVLLEMTLQSSASCFYIAGLALTGCLNSSNALWCSCWPVLPFIKMHRLSLPTGLVDGLARDCTFSICCAVAIHIRSNTTSRAWQRH